MTPDEHNSQGETSKKVDQPVAQKNSLSKPLQVFKVSDYANQQIQSLAFYKNFLIVGSNVGTISGFTWYKKRLTKKAWEVSVSKGTIDINSLYVHERDGILYAGCGDNIIYAVNLDDGKVLRSFSGHTDYVHAIDGTPDTALYSASEDGTIKIWDYRLKRSTNQLEPYKDERLERVAFGKWQGTVSVTDDWLLCGGGPLPCLYHLRSMECSSVFKYPSAVHVSGFLEDIVYVGGENKLLFEYNLKGDVTAEVPTSSSSIFSVVHQSAPEKFMSIAGSSNFLDICTNYNYRDVLLKLYEAPKKASQSH